MALKQWQPAMKILGQNFFIYRTILALKRLAEFANLQNTNCELSSCIVTELKLTRRQQTHCQGPTAENVEVKHWARTITLKKYPVTLILKHERNQRQTVLKFYTGLWVVQCCLLRSEGDYCQTCQQHFTFKGLEWEGQPPSTPSHGMSLLGENQSDIRWQPCASGLSAAVGSWLAGTGCSLPPQTLST